VQKNHLLIFSRFLDIWENVEWPRFLDHPVYASALQRVVRYSPTRERWQNDQAL